MRGVAHLTRPTAVAGVALAAGLALAGPAFARSPAASKHSRAAASKRSSSSSATKQPDKGHLSSDAATLGSARLWATIDVCKTTGTPVVGVRGSMPSDGHSGDLMYMRFGLQYLDGTTGKWTYLTGGVESGYTEIGKATVTRQAGKSFVLAAEGVGDFYEVRGVVEFQWRVGHKVVLSATRQTSAGHGKTVLHAKPPGYSIATCTIE